MIISRDVNQIIQENVSNAMRAAQDSAYPVSECVRMNAQWGSELKAHYQWLIASKGGDSRVEELIRLAGGGYDKKSLYEMLLEHVGKTTIYGKIFDERMRPDKEMAVKAARAKCFQDAAARRKLMLLLGWYDALPDDGCADCKTLLDNARKHDGWMGECGKSLEKIAECLMLDKKTVEKLRKSGQEVTLYTAFRVMITLSVSESAGKYGDDLYHFFGLNKLQAGETDRIADICGAAYSKLIAEIQLQCAPGREGSVMERDAHKVFWGIMYLWLKKNDREFVKSFSTAFFSKQNMEEICGASARCK